jgi:hypothetical protein
MPASFDPRYDLGKRLSYRQMEDRMGTARAVILTIREELCFGGDWETARSIADKWLNLTSSQPTAEADKE